MQLSKFSSCTRAALQLQLSTVPGMLATILDAEGNMVKDVEVPGNKPGEPLYAISLVTGFVYLHL